MSDDFDFFMTGLAKQEVLIPAARKALYNPDFEGFTVPVEPFYPRAYDGRFHPSSQATWTVRQLYLYLVSPADIEVERMPLTGVLAVTAGKFWHEFFQRIWLKTGELLEAEAPVVDRDLNIVGHTDGLLINEEGLEIKCMVPETWMERADGTRCAASEIEAGDLIIGWDEATLQSRPAKVVSVWDNGVHPTVMIATREGKELVVTENHPILTQRGWTRADAVKIGDKVRVGDIPEWGKDMKCLDPEEAHALGVLVGDGGLTGQTMYLTSADQDVVGRMRAYAENHGAGLVHADRYTYRFRVARGGGQRNPILDRLREQGLAGHGSHTKMVPPVVWQGGPTAWAEFLAGYLDADGTIVTTRTGTYGYLFWGSVNRALLLDCQVLLTRLGIRSSVVRQMGKYKGQPHLSWKLMIRDRMAVSLTQQILRPWCERKALDLASLVPGIAQVGHVLTAEFGWDRVKTIETAGNRQTIGLEIEGGTHLTNGIVTHNTINPFQISKVVTEAVLKEKKFAYWAQTQDYLMVLGLAVMRYFMINPSFPFEMQEFTVKADKAHQARRAQDYRDALAFAQQYPDPAALKTAPIPSCCAPKSRQAKECPVRFGCPIGQIR